MTSPMPRSSLPSSRPALAPSPDPAQDRPPPAPPASPPLPPPAAGASVDDGVEVLETAHPGPHAFLLKARASGRIYRVAPVRDPEQPRFWCVVVSRCSPAGLVDAAEPSWVGPGGIDREDLPAVIGAIRADVDGWLAGAPCRDLRRWLLAPAPDPPARGG